MPKSKEILSEVFSVHVQGPGEPRGMNPTIKDYKERLKDAGIPFQQRYSVYVGHVAFAVPERFKEQANVIFFGE